MVMKNQTPKIVKALIVVDVQKDFCPGGALAVPKGDEVVSVINQLIAQEFARGLSDERVVVYSLDSHPKAHCSFKANGGIWPPHCVEGSEGAKLNPNLNLVGKKFLKGTNSNQDSYSAFGGTEQNNLDNTLNDYLTDKCVEEVWVVGLALDYCVKATAMDARNHGFKTKVILAGTRAVNVDSNDGDRAIEELMAAGIIVE
jgi:nicotinamidase/pyrazinamidase